MNKKQKYIIISFVAISFLLVFAKSFYYTKKAGGVDLRHHIIAARLLGTNHSPYLYKPETSDGDYFLEGHKSIHITGNGTTVTPPMLFLFYPLSQLPYKEIRMIWLFMQFIFIMAILLSAIDKKNNLSGYFIPVTVVALGLICSNMWLMHVERGQVYVFYAFLISLSYWFYKKEKRYGNFFSGLVIGLSIFIRPLTAMLVLPFLLQRNQRWMLGCVAGVIAGFIFFVALKPSLWKDYYTAMQGFANEYTNKAVVQDSVKIEYHNGTIEGMNNLQAYSLFNAGNLDTFHNYFEMAGINISVWQSLTAFGIITVVLSIFFYRRRFNDKSSESLFLFGFLLYILSEIFIIAPRSAYCLVEWALPLFIICKKFQHNKTVILFIVTGLLFLHGFPFNFPFQFDIGEAILVGLLAYSVFGNQRIK